MRRLVPIAAGVALAFLAWLGLRNVPAPGHEEPVGNASVPATSERPAPPDTGTPDGLLSHGGSASNDLRILRGITANLLMVVKEPYRPPLGDNEDLAAALSGRNRMGVVFIPAGHPVFDDSGRLVDRWDTPLHVHARAADALDLRSAGPDRRLFTADDVVSGR